MALPSHLIDIQTIYLESVVEEYLRGREVLAAYPDAERIVVDSHWKIPSLNGNEGSADDWLKIKRNVLVLGVKKSLSMRPNGRSAHFIAPSSSNGCAMACAYCYVPRRKGYANPISLFVNIDAIGRATGLPITPLPGSTGVIDISGLRTRFEAMAPFLDERGRRLLTASEARAAGRGGVTAVTTATGVARSTIGRGLAELRGGRDDLGGRVRRPGGGRKPAGETQPGLLEALGELVQSAIRGDPEAALLWVSKSQRHLARALTERDFAAGQKLVGRLFAFITQTWRGKPLLTHQVIVQLIASTTTHTGLTVHVAPTPRASGCPMPRWPPSIFSPPHFTATELHHQATTAHRLTRLFGLRP